jgi:hypothetical protein
MPFFSPEHLADFKRGHQDVRHSWRDLQVRIVTRPYRNDRAREYAMHGLARRIGTLVRCIDRVYDLLPPEQDDFPVRDVVEDTTINIQAFVFNLFGGCDNLAWVWVYDRDIRDPKKPDEFLNKKWVGLGPDYKFLRSKLPSSFQTYLGTRENWFKHIKDFRDALGHRIPLYVPPYVVPTENAADYNRLEAAKVETMRATSEEYEQLDIEQRKLVVFQPIMQHSLTEAENPPVVFHSQLIADYNTIAEMTGNLLDEMDKP